MPRGNPALRLDNTPWPEARTNRLRHLFALGCKDARIAEELGVSIRAVIGKRLRLKLLRVPAQADDPLLLAVRRAEREQKP